MNPLEAQSFNKGSHKKRTKFIRFSQETLKLLIRYVNTERKACVKGVLSFKDEAENEPIFVTIHGRPYTYHTFYAQWQKIVKAAELQLNPHKTRHWHVTNMMRGIFETASTDAEIARKKKELIHYMRWRDESTIEVYEHYFNEMEFGEVQAEIFDKMRQKEQEYLSKKGKKRRKSKKAVTPETLLQTEDEDWLNEIFEGMGT
ncbi:site-specific integrase [Paenibacillus chondroitinus]|uniref:Site-specific integrase n=1 Tax=Paenibacillus chondroitinus TaxID=59842 RepID=A0ABU6DH93_9BACL|nr:MULTISPECIES: tyrosine-type recombinase/integrase [Paenibacillus]MCY9659511.1 site-specific integrase [Paenibacillus anseongense]MEB4796906.1 site-specific integrase [Paenibacillus chondroitinus]